MGKVSKIAAIISAKCPKCRKGDIFSGTMYGLSFQHTNEFCPHCGLRFEVEPGYFYAAMYVSYALNVMEMIGLGMLTFTLSNGSESAGLYIIVLLLGILFFAPFNFRYSRVILLHWLSPKIKYDSHFERE
ncbi:MAG TPA: hypothetical protein VNI52_12045 [Sphingobacteriaceae bacterium]|nr:hypothetical protein [Sphingobacteriaceae bacterium]